MATIITYTPLGSPKRERVNARGRVLLHRCEDVQGNPHRQRFPLGSVRDVFYLDALCLLCGTHFVWVEEPDPASTNHGAEK
ncbi:MAG: hypothetical protein KatS3mg077_0500 [Candidatus Binatia bacterium]|nr:MAG: hypothetical protein KatS3mg077_0500 [Candidatus Binatia bacterium]